MEGNKKYKFIEKPLSPLWLEGKIIYVLYDWGKDKGKELLKVICVKDTSKDYINSWDSHYFFFEKLNYNFARRLFLKNKWLVMTKDYKPRAKLYDVEDLVTYGKLHLEEALKVSTTLKLMGVDVPILEKIEANNNKLINNEGV